MFISFLVSVCLANGKETTRQTQAAPIEEGENPSFYINQAQMLVQISTMGKNLVHQNVCYQFEGR